MDQRGNLKNRVFSGFVWRFLERFSYQIITLGVTVLLQRLLDLPSEVQQMVIDEKMTQGHARAILKLKKSQDQLEMANRIVNENLSVRQTEQVIEDWNGKTVSERKEESINTVTAPTSGTRKKTKSPHVLELERQLQDILDLKVKLTADSNGKGKLEIYFRNNDDFSSLMEFFKS